MSATSDLHLRLVAFALETLATLTQDKAWSSETLDRIAADALDRELALTDHHGHFQTVPEIDEDIATHDFAHGHYSIVQAEDTDTDTDTFPSPVLYDEEMEAENELLATHGHLL